MPASIEFLLLLLLLFFRYLHFSFRIALNALIRFDFVFFLPYLEFFCLLLCACLTFSRLLCNLHAFGRWNDSFGFAWYLFAYLPVWSSLTAIRFSQKVSICVKIIDFWSTIFHNSFFYRISFYICWVNLEVKTSIALFRCYCIKETLKSRCVPPTQLQLQLKNMLS